MEEDTMVNDAMNDGMEFETDKHCVQVMSHPKE